MDKKVLLVEDDTDIANMLRDLLKQQHYQVINAYSGTEAILWLEKERPALILLDLMLPGMCGQEVLREIKKQYVIPVIVLSAIEEVDTKVEMLKMGAEDYITKPFYNEELLARMECVLNRYQNNKEPNILLTYKELVMDRENREVKVNNQLVSFTKNEFAILELLLENPSKVFTKNNIFESVWQEEYIGEDNVINVHVSNIRKKIAIFSKEEYIQTVWGIGFKMANQNL